ncbi:hypothetical protein TrVE_jg12753 [Triparma verrucosa]|uniref:Uncharacterized protein n=1 Tax=Triparma verrucosa TaxID=1606542 RepID=A0A9W7BQU9_9STRA|nr:hypothetical protein TrVE_jg12753 [Triparma verrucosa]
MFSTIDAVELTPSPSSSFDSYRSPLSSRHGHATVALPSAVVVLGGLQGEKYLNDVYILRDGDAEWSQVELAGLMMWSPRSGFGCCAVEGVIYVSGGCNADGCFNDLWKSEDEGANWTRIQENIDHFAAVGPKESYPARANFYMTYKPTSNSLVLLGGTDFSEAFNDVYEFDLNRRAPRRWSKVREGRKRIGGVMGFGGKYDCFGGRYKFWACQMEEVLYVGGGEDLDDSVYDDVWRSEDWGRTWEKIGKVREGKNQKGGIIGASACALGGVVFLFGGSLWGRCCASFAQTDFHNCYWSSKDAGMSWSKVMSTEREFLRSSMTATAVKRRNEIVMVGGWDGDDAVGESKSDDRKIVDTYIIV